jgi:hypothetical protein
MSSSEQKEMDTWSCQIGTRVEEYFFFFKRNDSNFIEPNLHLQAK